VPIYEYRCKKCGKTFEYMQSISEGAKRKCEACGQLALEKLISQTSFQLKGAGWYKDLYSSPKPVESKSGSEKAPSESGAGSGTGSGAGSGAGSAGAGSGSSSGSAGTSNGSGSGGGAKDKKTKKGTA
jgi:putative FmdB family regulatory protein